MGLLFPYIFPYIYHDDDLLMIYHYTIAASYPAGHVQYALHILPPHLSAEFFSTAHHTSYGWFDSLIEGVTRALQQKQTWSVHKHIHHGLNLLYEM